MTDKLTYRGYTTTIKYDSTDKLLYGKIEGITDLIMFESDSANDIEEAFHHAVDDYMIVYQAESFKHWYHNVQDMFEPKTMPEVAMLLGEAVWILKDNEYCDIIDGLKETIDNLQNQLDEHTKYNF